MTDLKICLVIPCYNEKARLPLHQFKKYLPENIHFLFVDDGSKDQTAEMLTDFFQAHPQIQILKLNKNKGKAEAVRAGMQQAALGNYEWIGFWDADLATPLSEVKHMLQYAALFYPDAESIWCSRVLRLGSKIHRSPLRHYVGRAFATTIDLMLGLRPYDSQCGAKLFKSNIIQQSFAEPFISRWAFDVELLMRLQNQRVIEYPVQIWTDVPGSKVKIWKDLFRVAKDLLLIRKRYLKS